jgi:hypothetical protein
VFKGKMYVVPPDTNCAPGLGSDKPTLVPEWMYEILKSKGRKVGLLRRDSSSCLLPVLTDGRRVFPTKLVSKSNRAIQAGSADVLAPGDVVRTTRARDINLGCKPGARYEIWTEQEKAERRNRMKDMGCETDLEMGEKEAGPEREKSMGSFADLALALDAPRTSAPDSLFQPPQPYESTSDPNDGSDSEPDPLNRIDWSLCLYPPCYTASSNKWRGKKTPALVRAEREWGEKEKGRGDEETGDEDEGLEEEGEREGAEEEVLEEEFAVVAELSTPQVTITRPGSVQHTRVTMGFEALCYFTELQS